MHDGAVESDPKEMGNILTEKYARVSDGPEPVWPRAEEMGAVTGARVTEEMVMQAIRKLADTAAGPVFYD